MSQSILTILLGLLSYILGFATAIFAEPIRQRIFKPKLKLEFGEGQDFKTRTPEATSQSQHEAYYIRVKVTNSTRRTARDCRTYLVNIEKRDETGTFRPTIYCDSIPLAWSCRADKAYQGVDLPYGVAQFLDVLTTRSISDYFEPQIMVKPFRYIPLFKEKGGFRFTIQVSAERANPQFIKLIFEWDGDWENFKVYEDY